MNPLTFEWIEKAEGDFATAQREVRVQDALRLCKAVRTRARA